MKIKKFGILINNLDLSQKCKLLIENINQLVSTNYMYSPTIFFINRDSKLPIIPRCLQIQQYNAWGYDDVLISTDIPSTFSLAECIRAKRKLFYITELEWVKLSPIIYKEMCEVYKNKDIDLIVNNQEQYDVISKCWKQPVGIVKDFNYEELCKYVN